MLLEAYFDDSGQESDRTNRFVCIAGYLSPTGQWEEFNRRWGELLVKHGLADLHMKLWSKIKRDKGWSDEHADDVLNEFIDVIRSGRLWGFGAGVDAQQWRALPRAKRDKFGSAQEFVMQRVFRLIADETEAAGLLQPFNLVFDQDEQFSKPRLSRYYDVKKIDPVAKQRASVISFADAKTCLSLQAADLLAYLTRARLLEREEGKPESALWKRLMTPLPGMVSKYSWDGWTGPNIEAELDAALADLVRAS
jgi:hypothetical protein